MKVSRSWTRALTLVGLALAVSAMAPQAWAGRVALLVGVGEYPGLPARQQLQGPPHDVDALAGVLQRRWGFAPRDVVVLKNQQASRTAILRALQALQERSAEGDEVLVYFSGHGTSAIDSYNSLPVPHGSGAFVPSDFNPHADDPMGGLIIGRRDLLPLFSPLDRGGRQIWVISDSCYSGQLVRSSALLSANELPVRNMPLLLGSKADKLQADLARTKNPEPPPPYPYRRVAYLAASAEGELANDLPAAVLARLPTVDGRPHGALTDALLRVLEGRLPADLDNDGLLSLNEVHRAVSDFMGQRAYGQTPQRLPSVADDAEGLGLRPVLGLRGAALAAPAAAKVAPLRLLAQFRGPAGLALQPQVQTMLRQLDGVQWLAPTEGEADLVLRSDGRDTVLLTAAGDILSGLPAADLKALAGQVQQQAWGKRIRQLAERHRRGVLPFEVDPAVQGGSFVIGDSLAFVVRPDREATLVLVNINAEGGVSVLYPHQPAETRAVPGGVSRQLPEGISKRIKVTPPVGTDLQFAFAFDSPPDDLAQWVGLTNVPATDGRWRQLEQALQRHSGGFTFAPGYTRALEPRPSRP